MKTKTIAIALLLAALFAGEAFAAAAGSCLDVTVTPYVVDGAIRHRTLRWECTSSSGGAVTEVGGYTVTGTILSVRFPVVAAPDTPTNAWDVTMLDSGGADVIGGVGANVPIAGSSASRYRSPFNADGDRFTLRDETVTPAVASAGDTKKVIIEIDVR